MSDLTVFCLFLFARTRLEVELHLTYYFDPKYPRNLDSGRIKIFIVFFRTERVPVVFVFGKKKIDIDHCCQSFQNCFSEKESNILMIYDVVYHHAIGRFMTRTNEQVSLVKFSFFMFICTTKGSYDNPN